MPIPTSCPECDYAYQVDDELAGKRVRCPTCNTRFRVDDVPLAEVDDDRRVKTSREKYCHECGAVIRSKAVICPKCGVPQGAGGGDESPYQDVSGKKVAAGIFGILLGFLGIHKFVLGMSTPGIIMIVVSLAGSCCYLIGPAIMWVVGFVEGIIYLTCSDQKFYETYIVGKRQWF